jgi:hypothetical protein
VTIYSCTGLQITQVLALSFTLLELAQPDLQRHQS